MFRTTFLLAALLACTPAAALAAAPQQSAASAVDMGAVRQRVLATRDMIKFGEYGTISAAKRRQIEEPTGRLQSLLDNINTLDQLSPAQQAEYQDAMKRMDAWLAEFKDERIICTMYKPTGSRIEKKECLSVAHRRQRAANARIAARSIIDGVGCSPNETNRCFNNGVSNPTGATP